MNIIIHKGTNEIGGSCIELSTDNTRILLDYGTPLKKGSVQVSLDKKIDAILISHPHQDHFGEIVNIDTDTPVYCGELSLNLMNAAKIFTGNETLNNNFYIYKSWKSFTVGDFKITPYLVDHSAVDAHAFFIECEGLTVLYSGDFRANGRKKILFEKMIEDKKLHNVDYLLMEGTMMGRDNGEYPDEQSVENGVLKEIRKNNCVSFMVGSSQNIDTIVSVYNACKQSNKILVVDMYTAWILENMKLVSGSVPNIDWDDVKVLRLKSHSYYNNIKNNKDYFEGFSSKIFNNIAEVDEIRENPSKYFLKVSPYHIEAIIDEVNVTKANIIYSQWLGYLESEFSDDKLVTLFKDLKSKYNWFYAHTSGHADKATLKKFSSSINPKNLIPIHTEHKDEFFKFFDNVVVLPDNEYFELNQPPFNV